jgi:predicted Zn-dependent protease
VPRNRWPTQVGGAVLLCSAAWMWASAMAANVLPFEDGAAVGQISEQEQRMWSAGNEFDDAMGRSDQVYQNEQLTAYVQAVMDKLFPEFRGRIRIRLLKSPQLNAFALPNGSVYVNAGLLARFENEAQLATVLAHEGTHFVNRHGFRSQENVKDTSAVGVVAAMLGVPPVVTGVLGMSSIFGYSRDLETEADNRGYERLTGAGYDVREAPKVFEHLAKEVKLADIKEPFFFSSHPKLQERIDSFTKLSAGAPSGGEVFESEYRANLTELRIMDLELQLSMGRYKNVLLMLHDEDRIRDYPPIAYYYLGEAYRMRKEQGDAELARQAYGRAVELAPEFAPSYRALGVYYMKLGSYPEAQRYLTRYVEMAPDAADRKYVDQYLETIGKQQGERP